MSGIERRTAYISQIPYEPGEKSGRQVVRFGDFASVVTGVGQCLEPFTINDSTPVDTGMPASFDPKDMMRRIDIIDNNPGKQTRDGETTLHAYTQWLRVGP